MKILHLLVPFVVLTLPSCGEAPAPASSSGTATADASGVDGVGQAEATGQGDAAQAETAQADLATSGADAADAPLPPLDIVSEVGPDAIADSQPDIAPDVAPEVTVEVAAEVEDSGTTPEVTSEVVAETVPETAPDIANEDGSAETAVETSPDVAVPDVQAAEVGPETTAPDSAGPTCTPTNPPTESCDGVDNDCNGATDEKGCDDGNPCTNDACGGAAGCQSTPNTAACNDNSACTGGDVCAAGKCAGTAVNCDDANSCTDDSCDAKTGCKHAANTATCDDGQACTTEACAASACKATPKVCKDADACTADSCDAATGDCAFAVIANCKACTANADCDDKDACTTDACTASKCANTKIAGCLPPPDMNLTDIKLANDKIVYPAANGALQSFVMSATLANLSAKSPGNNVVGSLVVTLNSEASNQGPNVAVVQTVSLAKSFFDFGAPTTKPVSATYDGSWYKLKAPLSAYQHLCMTVNMAGDANPANNTACKAFAIHTPQLAVTATTLADGTALANAKIQNNKPVALKVAVKNSDPVAGGTVVVQVFRSLDDKLDANDALIAKPAGQGTVQAAGDVTLTVSVTTPEVYNGPAWLCAKAVVAAAGQPESWDTNPADNVQCVPVTTFDLPDLNLNAVIAPANYTGIAFFGTLTGEAFPFGKPLNCSITVSNKPASNGVTGPTGAVPVTCALLPAGTPDFSKALWKTSWNSPPLAANADSQTWTAPPGPILDHSMGVSAGTFKATTPYQVLPGQYQACAILDPDGTITEVSKTNNAACKAIAVVAPNLAVTEVSLGTAGQELVAGSQYTLLFKGVNNGTCTTGVAFATRAYLSKDDKISADDSELYKYDTNPAILANGGFALTQATGASKVTVPAGFAKGAAFVIVQVDGLTKVYESNETDNVKAVAVVVK